MAFAKGHRYLPPRSKRGTYHEIYVRPRDSGLPIRKVGVERANMVALSQRGGDAWSGFGLTQEDSWQGTFTHPSDLSQPSGERDVRNPWMIQVAGGR